MGSAGERNSKPIDDVVQCMSVRCGAFAQQKLKISESGQWELIGTPVSQSRIDPAEVLRLNAHDGPMKRQDAPNTVFYCAHRIGTAPALPYIPNVKNQHSLPTRRTFNPC